MIRKLAGRPSVLVSGLLLVILATSFSSPGKAGNPQNAFYDSRSDHIFWFIHASDTHIGARGSADSANLSWLVTQARQVIAPSFILVSGDLTDSTNGNFLGYPNGPYQAEWDEYKYILNNAGITADVYYDIPGNHDAYNDRYFSYYLNNSVQGRATGKTQVSFVKSFPFGTYHFLGINTADNTGAPFSIFEPWGDRAGLDDTELAFIASEMKSHSGSALTLVFGHHPLVATDNAEDTYVYYGLPQFLSLMDLYYAPLYGYGHTHTFSEDFFIPSGAQHEGFYYFNVSSLWESSSNQYAIMAVDCNALASKTFTIGSWPAVLITAPADAKLGVTNPYAYPVMASDANPIRALVFDPGAISSVQYQIDGAGSWLSMSSAPGNLHLWQAAWDASALVQGLHTIEVKATNASGTSKSDSITVNVVPPLQSPQAGALFAEVGKYVTTGTKRNKSTNFVPTTTFYQGDSVVFRMNAKDGNGAAISGATVQLSITGVGSPIPISSGASDSAGKAEATWVTSAPNKRGTGGTPVGSYTATVTGVTASGYDWDGAQNTTTISVITK